MEAVATDAINEAEFLTLLEQKPQPVDALLTRIRACAIRNEAKAAEWTLMLTQELTDAADFAGLYLTFKERAGQLGPMLTNTGIRDALKKATKDRLTAALIDSSDFDQNPLDAAFSRLDRLLALKPGTLVIDPAWGLGTVKRLDDFYKRVTVDFTGKPGHPIDRKSVV